MICHILKENKNFILEKLEDKLDKLNFPQVTATVFEPNNHLSRKRIINYLAKLAK